MKHYNYEKARDLKFNETLDYNVIYNPDKIAKSRKDIHSKNFLPYEIYKKLY